MPSLSEIFAWSLEICKRKLLVYALLTSVAYDKNLFLILDA